MSTREEDHVTFTVWFQVLHLSLVDVSLGSHHRLNELTLLPVPLHALETGECEHAPSLLLSITEVADEAAPVDILAFPLVSSLAVHPLAIIDISIHRSCFTLAPRLVLVPVPLVCAAICIGHEALAAPPPLHIPFPLVSILSAG